MATKELTNKELEQRIEDLEIKLKKALDVIADHGRLGGLEDNDHPQYIKKDGTTADVSADIPFNNNKLTGVKDPTANQDAATKKWVEDNFSPL